MLRLVCVMLASCVALVIVMLQVQRSHVRSGGGPQPKFNYKTCLPLENFLSYRTCYLEGLGSTFSAGSANQVPCGIILVLNQHEATSISRSRCLVPDAAHLLWEELKRARAEQNTHLGKGCSVEFVKTLLL